MKKMLCFLLFVMSFVSFSQDSEELPRELWEDLVEIKLSDNRAIRKWKDDVKIGLHGNFTKKDSTQIISFIRKLDSITETIFIEISDYKSSNVQIKFSEIYAKSSIKYNFSSKNIFEESGHHRHLAEADVLIHKNRKLDDIAINYLKITIAKILFIGNNMYPHKDSGYDLFNIHKKREEDKYYVTKNDLKIIEEIYKKGFEDKIIKAEKLYKDEVLKKVSDFNVKNRDSNLWWVKNPTAIIVLPVLILLLIFLVFIKKIKLLIDRKIKDKWSRFSLLALLIVLFFDIVIIFTVSFYDFLITPSNYGFSLVRKDTILTTFFGSLILFPTIYLFRYIELKIQKSSQNIYSKTGLIFLSTGFLPFCVYFIVIVFAIELSDDTNFYNKPFLIASKIFLFLMSIASVRALISFFIIKERELIVENEIQLSHLRELKTQAELKSLQSQINPHFLYNSLNSIASLAPVDAFKTQKMAHSLSDLFKYSINRKGKKMSTIQDEINMVNSYLEIEKIRFGERLQFHIEVEELLLSYEIPLFLIQPLVENAIKHGVSKNKDKGTITLKIEEKEAQLNISVYDNGSDFPEGLVSGHGLQTVFDLLNLSYQDQASLNWTNEPEKMIEIKLPKNK